jgi:PAS domain S-box-containing protein
MRLNEALKRVKKATPGEPLILGYAVAVLSILAALIIALWMRMELGQPSTPIVVLFLCGVMFSAWFGGIGPSLLSIALSLLAIDYYFATPIHSFAVDIKEIPRLLIFTLSAFFIGSLSAAQRSKADSLRQARDVLDETVQDLNRTNQALRTENAERKHAEALLHAKEQEFRAIVENAPDHIIRYDRNFRRVYVNPAAARNYGLPAEALIGKPIGSVLRDAGLDVTEDALAHVRQKIADVFATGKSYEYELTWPMLAGLTYFSVRLIPELDLNGSVVNVLGISRDITKRKQAEEALDERLRFETLLTELSAAFANLSPNEVDREIDKWLKTLVESLGVDRASFFQLGEDWINFPGSPPSCVEGLPSTGRASLMTCPRRLRRKRSMRPSLESSRA